MSAVSYDQTPPYLDIKTIHFHDKGFFDLYPEVIVWNICWKHGLKGGYKAETANVIELKIKKFIDMHIKTFGKSLTKADSLDKEKFASLEKSEAKKICFDLRRLNYLLQAPLHNLKLCESSLREQILNHEKVRIKGVDKIYKVVVDLLNAYDSPSQEKASLSEFLNIYDHASLNEDDSQTSHHNFHLPHNSHSHHKKEDDVKNLIHHMIYPPKTCEGKAIIDCLKKYTASHILKMEKKADRLYILCAEVREYAQIIPCSLKLVDIKIPTDNISRSLYTEGDKVPIYSNLSIKNSRGKKMELVDIETREEYFKVFIKYIYANLNDSDQVDSEKIESAVQNLLEGKPFLECKIFKLFTIDFYLGCIESFKIQWCKELEIYELKDKHGSSCEIEFKDQKHCSIHLSKSFTILEKGIKLAHISIIIEAMYEHEDESHDNLLEVKMRFGEFYREEDEGSNTDKEVFIRKFDTFLHHFKPKSRFLESH